MTGSSDETYLSEELVQDTVEAAALFHRMMGSLFLGETLLVGPVRSWEAASMRQAIADAVDSQRLEADAFHGSRRDWMRDHGWTYGPFNEQDKTDPYQQPWAHLSSRSQHRMQAVAAFVRGILAVLRVDGFHLPSKAERVLRVPPELFDGQHHGIFQRPSDVAEALVSWMDSATPGASVTLYLAEMSAGDIERLPEV